VDIDEYWTGPYLTKQGETYEVVIDERFADGEYEFVCTPHIAMGMKATIAVNGGARGRAGRRGLRRRARRSGSPGAPGAGLRDGRRVKVFRLTAEKIRWETKEGKLVDAMAYNRMIPGPVIRVTEGDRVRIVVTNRMDEPHTTHWHGLFVPNRMDGVPGISQDPILPGESFTYEFARTRRVRGSTTATSTR
jgi:hypothetical protein